MKASNPSLTPHPQFTVRKKVKPGSGLEKQKTTKNAGRCMKASKASMTATPHQQFTVRKNADTVVGGQSHPS